jgi:hypothetical protein
VSNGDVAIVIRVNERYFIGFGKNGRVQTGWSLPSAKLFADWETKEIEAVETKLLKKGYKPIRMTVTCETEPEPEPEPEPVRAVCYSAQDAVTEVGLSQPVNAFAALADYLERLDVVKEVEVASPCDKVRFERAIDVDGLTYMGYRVFLTPNRSMSSGFLLVYPTAKKWTFGDILLQKRLEGVTIDGWVNVARNEIFTVLTGLHFDVEIALEEIPF